MSTDQCSSKKFTNTSKSETIKDFYNLKLRDASDERDFHWVDQDLIGRNSTFQGPFGCRRCVYMDYTASGKSMHSIEEFIYKNVLPAYANTHTTVSFTSAQTTAYRKEARDVIRDHVNAAKDDTVLFVGSGATAAINKLVHMIQGEGDRSPIVFVGPFEHHSNILPWRDMGATTINVPENDAGALDVNFLEKKLKHIVRKKESKGRLLIGVFSAMSNVTGALTDDVAVTVLLHQYGGLVFWDYAAAAPHVKIDMNPNVDGNYLDSLARKDAIYFSGHKFVGGPQTPGILVAKNHVFRNHLPHNGGGGTIFFVTPERHQYLQDKTEKEEGGTPAIVESIRLGLVLTVKNLVGEKNMTDREALFTKRALEKWSKVPELIILGNSKTMRGPIISFLVVHLKTGYFLHQNFVVALLNDLFGIQCRGGCMCAGPYSQILLGINLKIAHKYEELLSQDSRLFRDPYGNHEIGEGAQYDMIFRPGFTRVSFPFHAPIEEIDFVIDAVEIVARLGWKLLPLYAFSPEDSTFFYCPNSATEMNRKKQNIFHSASNDKYSSFSECLQQAQYLLHNMDTRLKTYSLKDDVKKFNPSFSSLRWFLLPSESLEILQNALKSKLIKSPRPFSPKCNDYKVSKKHQLWSPGSIPYTISRTCWKYKEENCQYSQKVLAINKRFTRENSTESDNNDSGNFGGLSLTPSQEIVKDVKQENFKKKTRTGFPHSKNSFWPKVGKPQSLNRSASLASIGGNHYLRRLVRGSQSIVDLEHEYQRKIPSYQESNSSFGYHSDLTSEKGYLIDENEALKDQLSQMRLEMRKAIDEVHVELRSEIRKLMSISQESVLTPHCMNHANGIANSSYHSTK